MTTKTTRAASELRIRTALDQLVAALLDAIDAAAEPAAPDRLLSVPEAATALGLGRSAVYGQIANGRLHSIKIGRRRLVPSSAIKDFIDASR